MTHWCRLGALSAATLAGSFFVTASATEIKVTSKGDKTAVVLLDEFVKGEAPVTTEADPGQVEIAFRNSMFGPVLFSETLDVPESGVVEVLVDMDARTVTVETKGGGLKRPDPKPEPEPEPVDGAGPPPKAGADESVVTVHAANEGMKILLDGKDTGKTTPAHLIVDPGRHVVKLTGACSMGEKEFAAEAGKTLGLGIDVENEKALLAIRTEPAGAQVYIDGKELGTAPMDAKLNCGDRTLKATKDGYLAKEVEVAVGEDEDVTITLDRDAYGSLEVSVEPADSDILLDGEKVGRGSVTLDKIAAGSHELTVERKGREVEKRTIEVGENKAMVLALVVSDGGGKAPKPDKPPKTKGNGPKVAPIVVGSAAIVGAVPLAAFGVYNYGQARIAYNDYLEIEDDVEAERVFREEVAPRQTIAFIEWAGAGVLAVGGGALVVAGLLDGEGLYAAPTPNGFVIGGKF
jgi:hypothetical protein